eukprot:Em0561g1a
MGCGARSPEVYGAFGHASLRRFPVAFGKKNKRLVKRARREWTHTFFCLSEVDADTVPTLSERTALQLQGLGEKQFPLPLDADAVVLDETLKREFPPLSDGGGYDLLTKEEGSSKHLNVIGCPPEGYTTAFLKGVVGAAKVYVRPLQKHIGTDTTTTRSQVIARELLKPHWETCSSSTYYPTSSTYYPTSSTYYPTSSTYYPTNPMYYATSSTYYPTTITQKAFTSATTYTTTTNPSGCSDTTATCGPHSNTGYDDDDASGSQVLTPQPHVDHIQISDDNEDDDDASGSEEMSTKDIVMNLKHGITEERWELSVRRQCILTDALKCLEHPSFAPTKRLSVQFQGEAGVDVGGLSREFFTLLMDEIRQHFWKKGTLIHNSKALKDGVYLKLGQLIAMAVVHSEIHTNLMGKPVYEYLSGRSLCSLKLQNITDEEQMHNFRIEHYEFLVEAGVMSTTLADKTSNLNELCLHSAILRSVAEIQQLAAGLKTLCVIDALEMYPSLMESYFIKSETAMTAAELRSTFIVTYSEDVDVRLKEEIALTY